MRRWTSKPRAHWQSSTHKVSHADSAPNDTVGKISEQDSFIEIDNDLAADELAAPADSVDGGGDDAPAPTVLAGRTLVNNNNEESTPPLRIRSRSRDSRQSSGSEVNDRTIQSMASAVAAVIIASRSSPAVPPPSSFDEQTSLGSDGLQSEDGFSTVDHSLTSPVLSSLAKAVLRQLAATDKDIAYCLADSSDGALVRRQKLQAAYVIAEVLSNRLEVIAESANHHAPSTSSPEPMKRGTSGSSATSSVASPPNLARAKVSRSTNGTPNPRKAGGPGKQKKAQPRRGTGKRAPKGNISSNGSRALVSDDAAIVIQCAKHIVDLSRNGLQHATKLVNAWGLGTKQLGILRAKLMEMQTRKRRSVQPPLDVGVIKDAVEVVFLIIVATTLENELFRGYGEYKAAKGASSSVSSEYLASFVNQILRSKTYWNDAMKPIIIEQYGPHSLTQEEQNSLRAAVEPDLKDMVNGLFAETQVCLDDAAEARWRSADAHSLFRFTLAPSDVLSVTLKRAKQTGKKASSGRGGSAATKKKSGGLDTKTAAGRNHQHTTRGKHGDESTTTNNAGPKKRSKKKTATKSGNDVPAPVKDRLFQLAQKHSPQKVAGSFDGASDPEEDGRVAGLPENSVAAALGSLMKQANHELQDAGLGAPNEAESPPPANRRHRRDQSMRSSTGSLVMTREPQYSSSERNLDESLASAGAGTTGEEEERSVRQVADRVVSHSQKGSFVELSVSELYDEAEETEAGGAYFDQYPPMKGTLQRPSFMSTASSDAGSVVHVKVDDELVSEIDNPTNKASLFSDLEKVASGGMSTHAESYEKDLNRTQVVDATKTFPNGLPESPTGDEIVGNGSKRVSVSKEEWKAKVLGNWEEGAPDDQVEADRDDDDDYYDDDEDFFVNGEEEDKDGSRGKRISFAEYDKVHEIPTYDEKERSQLFYSEEEICEFWEEADAEELQEELQQQQQQHAARMGSGVL